MISAQTQGKCVETLMSDKKWREIADNLMTMIMAAPRASTREAPFAGGGKGRASCTLAPFAGDRKR